MSFALPRGEVTDGTGGRGLRGMGSGNVLLYYENGLGSGDWEGLEEGRRRDVPDGRALNAPRGNGMGRMTVRHGKIARPPRMSVRPHSLPSPASISVPYCILYESTG